MTRIANECARIVPCLSPASLFATFCTSCADFEKHIASSPRTFSGALSLLVTYDGRSFDGAHLLAAPVPRHRALRLRRCLLFHSCSCRLDANILSCAGRPSFVGVSSHPSAL